MFQAVPAIVLSRRAEDVLKIVASRYLSTGEAVGSVYVQRASRLKISSATIRSVMRSLADGGLLRQAHTSAGRAPTETGLRYYVERIMRGRPLSTAGRTQFQNRLIESDGTPAGVVKNASRALSNICENTAIGRYPRVDGCIVSRLEFVSISRERSLAVLVFDDGRTKQRIFEHPDVGSDLNLHQVHGYFGLHWAGRSLNDIRNGLRDALQRAEHSDRKRRILEVTRSAIHDAETPDSTVIVEGLTFVLNEDLASSQATTLLSALDDKRLLLELLDQFIDEPGARLIFGSETKIPALKDCALVSVPYGIVGKRRGVVAILGGVRMDYGKIMPWVGFAGRAISAALEHKYSAA